MMEWNTNQWRRVLSWDYSCAESRRPSILPVPESYSSSMDEFATEERHSDDEEMDSDAEEAEDEVPWLGHGDKTSIVKGFPPVSPYIGVTPTLCYLLKEKKPLCCLQLCQVSQSAFMCMLLPHI